MGIFQKELGTPAGYGEWLVGDESQYTLASYHVGQEVILDYYELDILDQITKPDSETIFRPEFCKHSGRTAMALYVPTSQIENRWGDQQAYQIILTHEIGV